MSNLAAKQQGMSTMGFAALMIIVVFVVAIGLKLLPVYIEYFNVKSVLNSLKDDKDLPTDTVKGTMLKKFMINDVTSVGRNNINIEKKARSRVVTIDYEVRKNLLANIDTLPEEIKRAVGEIVLCVF